MKPLFLTKHHYLYVAIPACVIALCLCFFFFAIPWQPQRNGHDIARTLTVVPFPAPGASARDIPGHSSAARLTIPAASVPGTTPRDNDTPLHQSGATRIPKQAAAQIDDIMAGILHLRDPRTGLMPSHIGHPGYDTLGFLYDISANAILCKLTGHTDAAKKILDYFDEQLNTPTASLERIVDTNNVRGTLKLYTPIRENAKPVKSIINAFDISSTYRLGAGELEFFTTPGPTSFLLFAMAATDPDRYKGSIAILAELLLAMQDADGGIRDGDRARDRVHTEPHIDAYAALLVAYDITGDPRFKDGADRAAAWFMQNVYHPERGTIDQGMWNGAPSTIFATDCYSWTMAGPLADRLPVDEIRLLTTNMLRQALVKVTVPLPDGTVRTAILVDFANPKNARVINARRGVHPMGSVEWTGGVILALQKNAVRMWQAGDERTARLYKALAEELLQEGMRCFYSYDGSRRKITFYASGQGVEVAPFGALQNKSANGWKVPYYNVRGKNGTTLIRGGSTIGAWLLFPYLHLNPFIPHDAYGLAYVSIPYGRSDKKHARAVMHDFVAGRTYTEKVPSKAPDPSTQIVEPRTYNNKMWQALDAAYAARAGAEEEKAQRLFREAIKWASVVVDNPVWAALAKRDNEQKMKDIGGIIYYPWGAFYPENNHPLHDAIQKYPLLNETGAAMWGLATAYFELDDFETSKKWIERLITLYPLHQIAKSETPIGSRDKLITGYWNALISWEDNTADRRDVRMGELYREVLSKKGLQSMRPKVIKILPQ